MNQAVVDVLLIYDALSKAIKLMNMVIGIIKLLQTEALLSTADHMTEALKRQQN